MLIAFLVVVSILATLWFLARGVLKVIVEQEKHEESIALDYEIPVEMKQRFVIILDEVDLAQPGDLNYGESRV